MDLIDATVHGRNEDRPQKMDLRHPRGIRQGLNFFKLTRQDACSKGLAHRFLHGIASGKRFCRMAFLAFAVRNFLVRKDFFLARRKRLYYNYKMGVVYPDMGVVGNLE